ncbi:MAG TPA: TlpA disulfide reductase family protein [Niallia sp.]|nr:TlpA disulfide reductase family protein [Niallia sp.]
MRLKLLFLLLSILVFCHSLPVEAKEITTGVNIGNKAPDFKLNDLSGKTYQLSNLKGKKVMINFWTTWCPPCKKEMLDIERFSKEMHDQLIVLAINIDGGNERGVQEFVQARKLSFPILLDKKDLVSNRYQIISIPTTFFIDERGIIYNKGLTLLTIEEMRDLSKINE